MKFLIHIFLCVFIVSSAESSMLNLRDERFYPKPDQYPYNMIQKHGNDCTSNRIGTDLILGAAHCISDETGTFFDYNKRKFTGTLIARGEYSYNGIQEKNIEDDWAIWKIDDPRFYAEENRYLEISPNSRKNMSNVILAGYSSLRVLKPLELNEVRDSLISILGEYGASNIKISSVSGLRNSLNNALSKKGISPIWGDQERLKAVKGCSIFRTDSDFLKHNCDSSEGSSGAGLLVPNGRDGFDIAGIDVRGTEILGKTAEDEYPSWATKPERYYNTAKSLMQKKSSTSSVQTPGRVKIGDTICVIDKNNRNYISITLRVQQTVDYYNSRPEFIVDDSKCLPKEQEQKRPVYSYESLSAGVQFGAYSSQKNAEIQQERIRYLFGIETYLEQSGSILRVRAKMSESDAQDINQKCKANGISCFVFH